jgi:hypothetical protein
MAKIKTSLIKVAHVSVHKRTSQGGKKPKMQTMNKNKKATFKKYRGQGR